MTHTVRYPRLRPLAARATLAPALALVTALASPACVFAEGGAVPGSASAPAATSAAPVPGAAGISAQEGAGHTPLAGSYRINREKSDDPREKMREAMAGEGHGMGGPGGPGMGGGPPGGGHGGMGGGSRGGSRHSGGPGNGGGAPPGEGGPGGGPGEGRRGPFGSETITIRETGKAQLALEMDGGRTQTLTPSSSEPGDGEPSPAVVADAVAVADGQPPDEKKPKGRVMSMRSWWSGADLVVERKMEEGRKVTETYSVAPDGKQLSVIARLEGGMARKPVVILRVFDRVDAAEAAPQADAPVAR